MKAIRIHSYGGSDQLKLEEIPRPVLARDHLLVKIQCAGVNPVDWKIRAGYLKNVMPAHFPMTMGQDFAGDVIEVGEEVKSVAPGDRVFGFAHGSYAEFAAVPLSNIAKIPKSLNYEAAAALPTAGLTAYQIIYNYVKPAPGMRLLIHGAAGGVGSFAVQMAKNLDAWVAATAAGADIDYLKSLGVDVAIDYEKERFEDRIGGEVDAVVDLVGGETLVRSYRITKKGGLVLSTVAPINEPEALERNLKAVQFLMQRNAEELGKLAELVDRGVIKPRMSQIVPLDQAREAQELNETGKTHGKVVLKVA